MSKLYNTPFKTEELITLVDALAIARKVYIASGDGYRAHLLDLVVAKIGDEFKESLRHLVE